MRTPLDVRTQLALQAAGLPYHQQVTIYNSIFSNASYIDTSVRREREWDELRLSISTVIRSLSCHRSRWPEDMRETYTAYYDLLVRIRTEIDAARSMMLRDTSLPPDKAKTAPKVPATLARVTQLAARRNAANKAAGLPLEAECTSMWPSWASPAERSALMERFEIAYNQSERGRGNRVCPFVTKEVTASVKKRYDNLVRAVRRVVVIARAPGQKEDFAYTPYGALLLCCARMAERWLLNWHLTAYPLTVRADSSLRGAFVHDNPLPVDWRHALTREMRLRLADAEKDPSTISLQGLAMFYRKPEAPMPEPLPEIPMGMDSLEHVEGIPED